MSGSDLVFDILAPVFQSAATTTDGAKIILTYNEALAGGGVDNTPPAPSFEVTEGGSDVQVDNVAISGSTVELTMDSTLQPGTAITVEYDAPNNNAIQDAAGNESASFSATSVTNNTTAPVFQSAATNTDGTKVILTYNAALSSTTAATSAFAVVVNSSAATVSSVAVSGSTVELTMGTAITSGQTATVAYTDPSGSDDSNAVQGATGIDCASFTATSVTNNVVNIVTTGLDTHYDFGNSNCYTTSSNVISDLTSNNHDATILNQSYASYSTDQGGHLIITNQVIANHQRIVFDEETPLSSVGTGQFTLEFWFNYYSGPGTNSHLWGYTAVGSENVRVVIRDSGSVGLLRFAPQLAGGGWTYIDSSSTSPYTNGDTQQYSGWEHLVISRESTNSNGLKVYRNNTLLEELTNTTNFDGTTPDADDVATMADYPGGSTGDGRFPMKLGIYRLYVGNALTSTDVATNYNNQKVDLAYLKWKYHL